MDRDFTLTEFTEWMAEQGYRRSREEWYRRIKAGQIRASLHGHQWEITRADAQAFLESLRLKES